MSGGGDLENLRTRISEDALFFALAGRCTEVIWFMRFSVPRQIVLQSGHLWRLCVNCVGFDGGAVSCWPVSTRVGFEFELPELNPFCLRCVMRCFFNVLISRNFREHSEHVNGFSPAKINTNQWVLFTLCRSISQFNL